MRRLGTATAVLAVTGALLLSGCDTAPAADSGAVPAAVEQVAVDVAAAMGAEGQALAALGFAPADIEAQEPATEPTPSVTKKGSPGAAKADKGDRPNRRPLARVLLRRNTLHGEAVVQTKQGTRTVVVQRGEVTAIDARSVTVKSADGFTLTWTFGDKLRVVEQRSKVQPDQIKVGAQVGVAGARDGTTTVARLIVIPKSR
jgi:hypothetical protein